MSFNGTKAILSRFTNITTAFVIAASTLSGALPFLLTSNASAATTINVCQDTSCTYKTIQSGIDAASAGNTVSVAAGTYRENLNINKEINLNGNGLNPTTGSTIINDASNSNYTIFLDNQNASATKISGFTLKNDAPGWPVLKLASAKNLKNLIVTSNHFVSKNSHLIYAGNVSNSKFTHNTFYVSGITNNNKTNAGVYFAKSSNDNNTFKDNTFTGDMSSMAFGIDGDSNQFLGNNFENLTTDYHKQKVIEVSGSNNTASGNIFGNNQVIINPDGNFRGVYNTITAAVGAAETGDTLVATDGTYDSFRVNNTDPDNLTIRAAGPGAVIESVPGNDRIVDLQAFGTTFTGFTVHSAVANTKVGIEIVGSENKVNKNTIKNTHTGIQTANVKSSENTNPVENIVTNNTVNSMTSGTYGLAIQSPDNVFRYNTFNVTRRGVSTNKSGNTVEYNNFNIIADASGNSQAKTNDNAILNVKNNYWGSKNGIVSITGNGTVNSTPWLCSAYDSDTNSNPESSDKHGCLSIPTNLAPSGFTKDNTFSNTWNTVEDATSYNYELSFSSDTSTDGTFKHVRYADNSRDNSSKYSTSSGTVTRTNGPTADGTYYWHVQAVKDGQKSEWSTVKKLTVDTKTPSILSGNIVKVAGANNNYTSAAMNDNGKLKITIKTSEKVVSSYVKLIPVNNPGERPINYDFSNQTSHYKLKQQGSSNTYVALVDMNDSKLKNKSVDNMVVDIILKDNANNNHSWLYNGTASNYDNSKSTYYLNIDNAAPKLKINPISDVHTDTAPYVTGTTTDKNSPVYVNGASTDINTLNPNTNGTYNWSATLPVNTTAGGYTATATSEDSYSNISTTANAPYTILSIETPAAPPTQNEVRNTAADLNDYPFAVLGVNTDRGEQVAAGVNTDAILNNAANGGQVQGDETTVPSGNAEPDPAANTTSDNGAFLGLGWWWLLVLAVLAGGFWLLAGRKANKD